MASLSVQVVAEATGVTDSWSGVNDGSNITRSDLNVVQNMKRRTKFEVLSR